VVNLSNHATDVQQSKYPDEVDEPNGGGDAGEVNVTDLHAGIRLWHYLEQGKKEKRESAGTFSLLCTPPQTSNSEVALSGSSPSGELPQATQSQEEDRDGVLLGKTTNVKSISEKISKQIVLVLQ
jgi:hypothetical protein